MRRAPNRPQRAPLTPRRLASAFALAALGVLPAHAQSQPQSQTQIRDIPPRWVVITDDATPVRCDDFERFYKVASLDTGAVLRIDGQSQQWARVIYPLDVPALVPAADVRVIDDTTVELTTASRLRAPSMILGIAGSWRSLYSEAIPAGTRLEVIEKEIGANDEVAAYRVKAPHPPVAPEPPYAYVKLGSIRDASPAEAQAHVKAMSRVPGASPVPVEPAQIVPDAVEIAGESSPAGPATEPAPADPARPDEIDAQDVIEVTDEGFVASPVQAPDAAPRTDVGAVSSLDENSLLEPMVLPGQEEPTPPARATQVNTEWIEGGLNATESTGARATPAESARSTQPSGATETDARSTDAQPVEVITQGEPTPDAPAEQTIELAPEPASIEDLEQALTAARRLPKEALDEALDELRAEFTRTLHAEEASGQDEKILEALRRRVAWLDLRIETRDQRRALDAALAQASSREVEISRSVRTWQSSRSYSMVGRLAPSAVYDGQRLPLMYRVQSIDPLTGPRTIGYVRPGEGQRFDDRLGRIVGIIGSTTDDDALSLRIIRPERVDALDASTFATAPTE